ncbi:Dabb family protein [Aspergillus homomorphus CBS 101889]|uniref:Stress responsive A/B barrel domain protein n=1 Tax=Aspergillus homomorphus (strain CBS 101889) TaxID=1450537 RepID=A0A395HN89_ASPHC|nr:stress responsive A/B barrel domain protein [Aspergillus homomorphus CBS 101889]RAL08883.1 stress responsive A/B barrel domain protein [Aspergillus homomorphus CBS 101889]
MPQIERITLFKIPNEEDIPKVLEQFKILGRDATKDGKPYIINAAVGQSFPDARNQGWNVSVKTAFASLDDMKFYDQECEAHKALKAVVLPLKQDIMTTYFESIL